MVEKISRRSVLRGLTAAGPVSLCLPPLEGMFNGHGTAFAATADQSAEIPSRFVFWFNGNGVPERYWHPKQTGHNFALTPCLSPLAPHRDDIQVITGLDNLSARRGGTGGSHTRSQSGVMTCTNYTGRGAGGPSLDQLIANKIGGGSRLRSLQIGVASESFGESIQRNMSWVDTNRPLPAEMVPHRLFDRLFGQKDLGWVARKKSILDAINADATTFKRRLGGSDRLRMDEHLSSIRDLERAISSLPPQDYDAGDRPDESTDTRDYPRVAKVQTNLLVHALAAGQTRVASYMLTRGQSLTRFPWLGHTVIRHHDYTHYVRVPGSRAPAEWGLRDICRWHVEEFAYLIGKLKSIPEGDGNLLDHTSLLFVHEHAEGNVHKDTSVPVILAGHKDRMKTNTHLSARGSLGDLYVTVANDIIGAGIAGVPTGTRRLTEILRT